VLAVVALVGGLVAVGPQASAAPVIFDVRVGAFPTQRIPAESMRFFPGTMDAHQGDTLHFTSQSFHSATFMPAGVDPDQWVADNATAFDDPFAAKVADPDEGPKAAKFGLGAFLPSDFTCGTPGNPAAWTVPRW
jgi:plastocyanin